MEFEIAGAPVGKRRPRFSTINGFAQAIKVDADVEYENMVRLMFRLNKPTDYDLFDKPVRVRIELIFLSRSRFQRNGQRRRLRVPYTRRKSLTQTT